MNAIVTGFICVTVLAAVMIAWIAYCMFYKERHKSQVHYDITDLKIKNYEVAQDEDKKKKVKGNKAAALGAGIFILPSRHKQNDDYDKRPDYPESPVKDLKSTDMGVDKLIDVFNDSTGNDANKDENNSEMKNACTAPYHSDV